MNNLRNTIRLLILCLLIFSEVHIVKSQKPQAEFYYYDATSDTFIIQDTDGNIHKEWGQKTEPASCNWIDGDGWSHDSTWFVWYKNEWLCPGLTSTPLYLYQMETGTVSTFYEGWIIRETEWSPIANELLVVIANDDSVEIFIVFTDRHYVPDIGIQFDRFQFHQAYWSSDGQSIIVSSANDAGSTTIQHYQYHPESQEFNSIETTILPPNKCRFSSEDTIINSLVTSSQLIFLDSGQLIWQRPDNTVMKFDTNMDHIATIDWNLNYRYGLILARTDCKASPNYDVWLLSTKDGTLTFIQNNILLDTVAWSPTLDNATMVSSTGDLYLLDAMSQSSQKIMIGHKTINILLYTPVRWFASGTGFIAVLQNNEDQIYLYRYNLADNIGEILSSASQSLFLKTVENFSISPDGNYLAFSAFCGSDEIAICVTNLDGTDVAIYPSHSLGRQSVMDFFWHPSSEWFIGAEALTGSRRMIALYSTKGTYHELAGCTVSKSCFGWINASGIPLTDKQ